MNPADNISKREELREIDKCGDIIDYDLIDDRTSVSGKISRSGGSRGACTYSITKYEGGKPYRYEYYPSLFSENLNCNIYDKRIIAGIYYDKYLIKTTGPDSLIDIQIRDTMISGTLFFGDGNSQSFSNTININLVYTYGSLNTFLVDFVCTFKDKLGNNYTFDNCDKRGVIVTDLVCSEESRHVQGSITNNNWKMSYKIYVTNRRGKQYLGCWSRAWKEVRTNVWKHRKTMIQAYCKGVFRDDNCSAVETPESINKNKCRRKLNAKSEKYKNKRYDISNGDCYSVHALTNRGINHIQPLDPC